jgi:hypothetical protein
MISLRSLIQGTERTSFQVDGMVTVMEPKVLLAVVSGPAGPGLVDGAAVVNVGKGVKLGAADGTASEDGVDCSPAEPADAAPGWAEALHEAESKIASEIHMNFITLKMIHLQ